MVVSVSGGRCTARVGLRLRGGGGCGMHSSFTAQMTLKGPLTLAGVLASALALGPLNNDRSPHKGTEQ